MLKTEKELLSYTIMAVEKLCEMEKENAGAKDILHAYTKKQECEPWIWHEGNWRGCCKSLQPIACICRVYVWCAGVPVRQYITLLLSIYNEAKGETVRVFRVYAFIRGKTIQVNAHAYGIG